MDKYVRYGTVIMSAGIYAITDLYHPHLHIEQTSSDTAPVQQARLIVVSTATSTTLYKALTVGQGSSASVLRST
jgi:hypothetical protein